MKSKHTYREYESVTQTQHIDLPASESGLVVQVSYLNGALPDHIVADLECLKSNVRIHVVTLVSRKWELIYFC